MEFVLFFLFWEEKLVAGPRWVPDTKTDWPTDRRSSYNFDFDFDFINYTEF
jgi:hypothetical protein